MMRVLPTLAMTILLAVSFSASLATDDPTTLGTLRAGEESSEERSYPLGDATYDVPADHSNLMVSAEDLTTSTDVPLFVCWLNPEGDDICGDDDVQGENCGPMVFTNAPFSGGTATATVTTVSVRDDLTFCLATAGTITFTSW